MRNDTPRIALVGQPNSGKSTLFNFLAGLKAKTSNFPGTTVKITESTIKIGNRIFELVDLPGSYSLHPFEPAENVTTEYLIKERIDIIVNVIDSSILARGLELTLELIETGIPVIVVLNQMDEAEKKGIKIYGSRLERILGVPVVETVALYGRGIAELTNKIMEVYLLQKYEANFDYIPYPVKEKIEDFAKKIELKTDGINLDRRFLLLELLEGNPWVEKELLKINPQIEIQVKKIRESFQEKYGTTFVDSVMDSRHSACMKIAEEVSELRHGKIFMLDDTLDRWLMHPILGYVFMAIVFLVFFWVIFKAGAALENLLLKPFDLLEQKLSVILSEGFLKAFMKGILQGFTGAIGIVLPYLIPLSFLMTILEDLGYLPRMAFLLDSFMHRIGLHGKSVPPFILGYGCNVPAILSTRIIESEKDRILTTLLIPFIPCSARILIITALVASFLGPFYALLIYFLSILVIAIIGKLSFLFFRKPSEGFLLEIPSYRIPSLNFLTIRTYFHIRSFLFFAVPILIAGSGVLGILDYIGASRFFNSLIHPFLTYILGLPKELGTTLIFGFFRKELTLLMALQALGVSYSHLTSSLSSAQIMTFTVFVTFYIPCLATISTMGKELGWRIAIISLFLSVSVATILGFATKILFSLLPL